MTARHRWRRLVPVALTAVAVTAALVGLLPAPPAFAHSQLRHTSPADGATVTSQLDSITLTFNEMVHGNFTTIVVSGPGGVSFSNGPVKVIDDDAFQSVYPLRSGDYQVAWRAISADGHPVQGTFHFAVSLSPGEEPTARPPTGSATSSQPEHGWLIWGGLAVALILAAGAFRVLARRPGVRS